VTPDKCLPEMEWRQHFVSDVFHSLSQPLTALRCSLELALMQDGTVETYREALRVALTHAERVSSCAVFLRAMAEAEDPGFPKRIDLSAVVAGALEEFLPVVESLSVRPEVDIVPNVFVSADEAKLSRALMLVLDACASQASSLNVGVSSPAKVEIAFAANRSTPNSPGAERAEESYEVAKKMFCALGAITTRKCAGDHQHVTIVWPEPLS